MVHEAEYWCKLRVRRPGKGPNRNFLLAVEWKVNAVILNIF